MVDYRGLPADLPPAAAAGEVDELVGFDVREAECARSGLDLVGLLGVDDAGGAVGEEAVSQGDGFAAGGSDGAEVGDAVDDGEVGDPECPRQLPLGLSLPLPLPLPLPLRGRRGGRRETRRA